MNNIIFIIYLIAVIIQYLIISYNKYIYFVLYLFYFYLIKFINSILFNEKKFLIFYLNTTFYAYCLIKWIIRYYNKYSILFATEKYNVL